MARVVSKIIYNLLVFPLLYIGGHMLAIASPKIRDAVVGRHQVWRKLEALRNENREAEPPVLLVHCSSMGEYEHVRPILTELSGRAQNLKIVVMFFSPSGFKNVKSDPAVSEFIYAPFDSWLSTRKLVQLLNPKALVVAKYDVWPNMIWACADHDVPILIVNGTIKADSLRLIPVFRWFLKPVYDNIVRVLTISESDANRYQLLVGHGKSSVAGDSKFDQAIHRSRTALSRPPLPKETTDGRFVMVCGSTWPEDEVHLLPALQTLRQKVPSFLAIICPHDPTKSHIKQLENSLGSESVCRFSRIKDYRNEHIILVDRIGVLAELYGVARVAYVGGSFKQNIHNVLEPAASGIPVLFGPVHKNSIEAVRLIVAGAAFEVNNAEEIERRVLALQQDESRYDQAAGAAEKFVQAHAGATRKIADIIVAEIDA